jgi:hypothetical protein
MGFMKEASLAIGTPRLQHDEQNGKMALHRVVHRQEMVSHESRFLVELLRTHVLSFLGCFFECWACESQNNLPWDLDRPSYRYLNTHLFTANKLYHASRCAQNGAPGRLRLCNMQGSARLTKSVVTLIRPSAEFYAIPN